MRVLNLKKDKIPADAVYIGRPSKWGNPFHAGVDGKRHDIIMMYRKYLIENKELMCDLPELKGKDLVCYCAPLPCHGDILKDFCNE